MADDQDESQKTEEPSQKRLADAHEKGDVPKSQEISTWFLIAGGTFVIAAFGGQMATSLSRLMTPFLQSPEAMALDAESVQRMATSLVGQVAGVLALPLLLLMLAGLAGHIIQARPSVTTSRIEPKLDKISPLKGFGRLFGRTAIVNLVKGLLKLGVIAVVGVLVLWPERDHLGELVSIAPALWLPITKTLTLNLLGAALGVLGILALVDYGYQRFEFLKRNRMTKQEVRDEFRQMEGDPTVKAKIRQIRAERSRQRMMAKIPQATVIVTNPTHYAVALLYESGKMVAPRCVAKGVDSLALRIRAVAEEHEVPIVENPALARALYATVEVDGDVPPEHYKAVAGVIGYVLRLRGALNSPGAR